MSSAILANVLKGSLPERLASVADSTFAAPDLSTFSAADADIIANAYADASRAVFIWCCPLAGIAFLLNVFIKDKGLVRKEEQEAAKASTPAEVDDEDVEKGEPVQHQRTAGSETKGLDALDDEPSRKPSLSSQRSITSGRSEKRV